MIFQKDFLFIYAAALLRALGVSIVGTVVAIYWATVGFSSAQIGILVSLGLAGGTLATFCVSLFADKFGRRRMLLLLSMLSVLGGVFIALNPSFLGMCVATFIGMLNGMGRDRMAAFSLEQALLAQSPDTHSRTKAFAGYNLIQDIGHASGSLLASLPFLFRKFFAIENISSYQWTFVFYSCLLLISGLLYFGLSQEVEIDGKEKQKVSPDSFQKIKKFGMLSFLDSFGGGFLTGALISYWFFKRFGVTEEVIGTLFFFARVANGVSFIVAAWLSKKIGLINTMVFTHIPASICLMIVPFMPSFWMAALLYIMRECLVEMDVPTRQAYLSSIVQPHERTFALGIVNVVRNLAWSISPVIAGSAMKLMSLSAPLFAGPSIKICYDLLLYKAFRKIKPSA